MTFSEYLDNDESVAETIGQRCQPSMTRATQLRCDILALHPEMRGMMTQLDNAYMEYADDYAEQHVIAAEKFYGEHS